MLNKISYDAEAMKAVAEKARTLRDNVDQTRKELIKHYMDLQMATNFLELRTGNSVDFASVVSQKALREQAERLEKLVDILYDAAGLADEVTNETNSWLDELRLRIFAKGEDGKIHINPAAGAAAAVTAISGTFGALTSSLYTGVNDYTLGVSEKIDAATGKVANVIMDRAIADFIADHPDLADDIKLLRNNDYTDKQIYNLIRGGEDAVEKEAQRYGYTSPLGKKALKITARYPRYSGGDSHPGIDFKAPEPTPLYAIKGGTVLFSSVETKSNGKPGMGGNCILIQGEDGYYYYYAHLSKFNVTKPMKVVTGDLIGWTGNTSNQKMAYHLHLSMGISSKSPLPTYGETYVSPNKKTKRGFEWCGPKCLRMIDPYLFLKDKGVIK